MYTLIEFEERPWGYFEVILRTPFCKVIELTVDPGQRLSYQFHTERSESWTVVKGRLNVILNGVDHLLTSGDTLEIPVEAKHRAWNKTDAPVTFIEVQTGTSFEETDIVRLEDDYNRT